MVIYLILGAHEYEDFGALNSGLVVGSKPGDVNSDGYIDETDYFIWVSFWANRIFLELKDAILSVFP